MALNDTRAPSSGVWTAIKGALNIFSGINKAEGVSENTSPTPEDEYESSYSELEVTELVGQWKRSYTPYYSEIETTQKLAFEYWIGKQRSDEAEQVQGSQPLVDNLMFESIETFLPIATRANPDPLVTADSSPQGQAMAKAIKAALIFEADKQKFRMKLKRLTRHWIIYRIGVAKVVYDIEKDCIETLIINPKRMIFDKDGYIDEGGNFVGEYIGEKKRAAASTLIQLFPKKKTQILSKCQGKLGTKLEYMEWWYRGMDVFYTMEDVVLGKFKNPHWNYDGSVTRQDPVTGADIKEEIEGTNHVPKPAAPYVFLSVFSTGLQPHDETSLILQNIGIQDMINRRMRQIDKNVEAMNNGMVVSGKSFTEEQASQAASALRRGTAIRVPNGDVREAVARFPAPELPPQVFDMLRDGRGELRNIFGTSGATPEGIASEDTARGKILVNQLDSSRIGGGVTEYIEQVADSLYNWWVQFMFVHYTNEHYITAAGEMGGTELLQIKNSMFPVVKSLNITVKEGSLIPKDPLTQRNEAIDLWSANAIDPISFYKRLDFSDPSNQAKQLILWQQVQAGKLPPQMYLPDFPVAPLPPGALPTQGVGDEDVNNIGQPGGAPTPTEPGSAGAVAKEGQQLMESVPVQ